MTHIVSIQSHVAYGYVGNRAAAFALQRMGIDVTAINTVQFSNHTGYDTFTGDVFTPAHLCTILDGVQTLTEMADIRALISGYIGDEGTGEAVLDGVHRVRSANPGALYCCDPVMGDVGRGFFVHPDIPTWMRDHAVPAADIVTPNQFELAWLAGRDIGSLEDAIEAAATLRQRGPSVVLVTSLDVGDSADGAPIEMLLDTQHGSWRVTTPRVHFDAPPSGAGDFTAAMFLAHCLREGMEGRGPVRAFSAMAAAVQMLFEHTRQAGTRELAIIAAQEDFVHPPVEVRAETLR